MYPRYLGILFYLITRSVPKIPAAGHLEGMIFWDNHDCFGFLKLVVRRLRTVFILHTSFQMVYLADLTFFELSKIKTKKLQHVDLLPQVKIPENVSKIR